MKTKTSVLDLDLIIQYQKGDDSAFETLLLKYKNKIFTSILIIVKDEEIADDIFQDTFIKILDKLRSEKYNEEGKFLPWALRISHNLCMDHSRKNQKEKIVANDNPEYNILDNISSEYDGKEDQIIADEGQINIAKYLELLPDEQREVVVLRHYYDYSFKEIAEITGTNLNTSLGRMRYALINLRKLIQQNKAA
jgi:RNA polymerase sigma-70 factor (ECF subfamily)